MNNLEDLSARTRTEIDYDNMVLRELRGGKDIKQALQIAAAQHPDESWLICGEEDLVQIKEHYLALGKIASC